MIGLSFSISRRFAIALWSIFLDVFECNSKQKSPSEKSLYDLCIFILQWSSRFFTTRNAASFSHTNRTFLPLPSACAIRFVIVCDFPVPGGPDITMSLPFMASKIAACWEESASFIKRSFSLLVKASLSIS